MKAKNKRSKEMLSSRKVELYDKNARTIEFYRNNPCIASEELIGVKLLDAQKIILNRIWVADYSVLACS